MLTLRWSGFWSTHYDISDFGEFTKEKQISLDKLLTGCSAAPVMHKSDVPVTGEYAPSLKPTEIIVNH